jgi:peptide/nickel transport system permease protein
MPRPGRWKQFRKSRSAWAAVIFVGFLVFVAVFADLLANNLPLYCRYNGEAHFPVFTPNRVDSLSHPQTGERERIVYRRADWRELPLQAVVWAPIPYDDDFTDRSNYRLRGPGAPQYLGEKPLPKRFRHWLGTTRNGQDVFAIILYGTRVALLVGFFSMGIAALIGVFMGAIAGYFGDRGLKGSRAGLICLGLGLFLAYFYAFYLRRFAMTDAGAEGFGYLIGQLGISLLLSGLIMGGMWGLSRLLRRVAWFGKKVYVPLDLLISRLIEVLRSLPIILVVISFSVVFEGSLWMIVTIIGLTGWTGIARHVRAEMLRVVNLNYVEAARSLGYSARRVLFRHALPNGLAPALVAVTFGVAGAIIAETALSYLGIGGDPEMISWGKMMQMGKENRRAWWLLVFPGIALFFTVLSLNLIGERRRDVLDPRKEG